MAAAPTSSVFGSVDGDYFALGGLSMGDMVRINREFARVIREAKHARVV